VDVAREARAGYEQVLGAIRAVTPMEDPGDPEVLLMADASGEDLPCLPGVGQLVVGHAPRTIVWTR
jgi:hypothetical protein